MYRLSLFFKEVTQHAFVYDSHFSTKERSELCCSIIDIRINSPICELEGNHKKSKGTLKNMLRKLFDENCIVEFLFKFTENDSSAHIMDIY